MNPNTTIRPWLLACGKQFGIRQAHEYRWPDAETRPHELYCTYQSLSGQPTQVGTEDHTTKTSNQVHRKGSQVHEQIWQIDLYNSEDGLCELEAFCVAAHHSEVIEKLFYDHGCAFKEAISITNETTFDDEDVYHHFRMVCVFIENVDISLDEVNNAIDDIDFNLETGSYVYNITQP